MNKLSLISILLSLFLNLSQAQQPDIAFEHYTISEGLASDNVFALLQDQQGFLWFGTFDGLSKFDGYSFTNYYNNQNDSTSLSHNSITSICENPDGKLWITTLQGGINLFDPLKETVERIYQYPDSFGLPFQIIFDQSGDIWIGTTMGVDHYDPDTRELKHFEHDPEDSLSLSAGAYYQLHLDKKGTLWVVTGSQNEPNGGLNRYNPSTDSFIRYSINPGDKYSTNSNLIEAIAEDNVGNLYVGTYTNSLLRYDQEKDSFESVSKNNHFKLFYSLFNKNSNIWSSTMQDFIQDKSGNYWIKIKDDGIMYLDAKSQKIQHLRHNPEDNYSLSSNNVQSVFEDKYGVIWVITDQGVNKVIPSQNLFNSFTENTELFSTQDMQNINTMIKDSSGKIWLGSTSGDIFITDGSLKSYINLTEQLNFDITSIYELFKDYKNRIWIGTEKAGLILYSPASGNLNRYLPDKQKLRGLSYSRILSIGEDSDHRLWVAVGNFLGADLFNPADGTFKNYHNYKSDNRSLSNNVIRKFFKDSENDFWLGTANGLNRYNKENDDFDRYLPETSIRSIYEDSKRHFWITTQRNGLILFDRKTGNYKVFTVGDGLLSNYTNNIIEDNEGYIWISSPAGLTRLDPETMVFISFDKKDGLDNKFTRDVGAVVKLKSGELVFSGIKGMTTFLPGNIHNNKSEPNVIITDILSHNLSLKQNSANDSVINLDFDQNDLTFHYVALHYKNPALNKYSIKLEPYESDWQKPTNIRRVRYTNLSPGQYKFSVKASNSDGIWNEEGRILKITINPPLWATWWAYIIYVLFGIGLLFSIRKFELNRRREKEESKRKSEELEEARQLQLSMLPKELPQLPHLDIAVYMQTATEVGGDYYDFHVALDGTLTVVIGDATGHGMKAGTMVTSVKSLFNTHAGNNDILFSFNEFSRCIRNMNFGRVSMCLTMLKISDHTMQIATAAMPPSYIYRIKTKEVEEYQFEAMPLGAMEEFPYQAKETQLNPGDTVLLYSDGLPELENKKAEMYGYSRICEQFTTVAEKSSADIISHLKNEGANWVNNADPGDDVTFVVIKVK